MATIINIRKYQKVNVTQKNYKEISLISQINIALYHLYDTPAPKTVMIHYPEGAFSSYDDIDAYLAQITENFNKETISSTDELVLNHFIITQEEVDGNSIILGFFNLGTKVYNRYKIKDLRRLCELLRVMQGDFSQILGKASPDEFKIYNTVVDKKRYLSEINSLISNASFTSIQDVHILKMLKYFNVNGGILCPVTKEL